MKAVTTTQVVLIIGIIIIAGAVGVYFLYPRPKTQLIVSTTTSLYETGMLDLLKERFEQNYPGYNVSFISQGTGKAIATAKSGDADMILVHDPVQELAFLNDGYGVNRKIIAYNFFIIVGPSNDPAGIQGKSPLEALTLIKAAGEQGDAQWVSRGDNSGTHAMEKRLWTAAGFDYAQLIAEHGTWYVESGTGMTATLSLANEKNAYTLSDVASYLKNSKEGNIELTKLVDAWKETLNVYCAIACNPEKLPGTKFDAAMTFIRFLLLDETQELFRTFGVEDFGEALFKPWIPLKTSNSNPELVQWIEEYAYFEGSECPTQYRYNAGNLYG